MTYDQGHHSALGKIELSPKQTMKNIQLKLCIINQNINIYPMLNIDNTALVIKLGDQNTSGSDCRSSVVFVIADKFNK